VKTTKRPVITEEEQCLLECVQVRPIQPEERQRYDQLMGEQHYLGNPQLVGEQMRFVAEYKGQWVGLLAWSAGAYRLKLREGWIGWSPSQKKRRLSLVANNSRFLILEEWHSPNLASRLLKLCLARLSQDWEQIYGHGILLVETFVDPQQFRGTCYRASGWTLLGQTMEALRFPRDWSCRHRRYRPPSESSFFRMLSQVNPRQLEKTLLDWQDQVLGKRDPVGDRVAVDGKELLNSQGQKIASAYSVRDGRWLGSEAVAEGSNEIPAVQELLRRADIEGSLVTADAMNTQTETARIIVQEPGADYLFTVKGNQKGVAQNVQQLYQSLSHAFSPSTRNGRRSNL